MKNSVIAMGGAAIIVSAMLVWKVVDPILESRSIQSSSDSSNIDHTIRVGMDNWVGYVPFCSGVMNKLLRRDAIQIRCVDDGADYDSRMSKLKTGELDLALVETGAYVLEGKRYGYPGVFIAAIDSSQGDAIVVDPKVYPNLAALRKDTNMKIPLVPKSPSEFFGYYTEASFGVELSGHDWMVEKDNANDVYDDLIKGHHKVAILWEPYVTMAEDRGFKRVLSTSDAKDVIIDALVANRSFLTDRPELTKTVLSAYFKTLKHFRDNPTALLNEVRDHNPALTSDKMAKSAIDGARWITFTENCNRWFGCDDSDWLSEVGIEDTLNLGFRVWRDAGIITTNPFPDSDPFNLINSSTLKSLFTSGIDEGNVGIVTNPFEYPFEPWTDQQWAASKYLDKLRTGPILFKASTNVLLIQGRESLDNIADQLKQFPSHRLRIEGHTGTRGDDQSNIDLSLDRAKSVETYLVTTYNIDPDRIQTVGLGGHKPLELKPGENSRSRSYTKRLKRVEIHLLENKY